MITRWEMLTRRAAKKTIESFNSDTNTIFHYKEGESIKICAIFDSNHVEISMGGEVSIDSVGHYIVIEKYVLKRKPINGDMITRRNITYEVVLVEEDGSASYRLQLHEVDKTKATRHFEII